MVEAWWDINNSHAATPEEKELIRDKLKNRINKDGYLLMRCSETRSQLENKQIVLEKITDAVTKSLLRPKKRKPTKPSKAARERRLDSKKKESIKKQLRNEDFG